MTLLQQMAFERLANLNAECRKILPRQWNCRATSVNIPIGELEILLDRLSEQANFIEALWDEERKDGCEEII